MAILRPIPTKPDLPFGRRCLPLPVAVGRCRCRCLSSCHPRRGSASVVVVVFAHPQKTASSTGAAHSL